MKRKKKLLPRQPPRRKLSINPPQDLGQLIIEFARTFHVSTAALLTLIVEGEMERRGGDLSEYVDRLVAGERKRRKRRKKAHRQ